MYAKVDHVAVKVKEFDWNVHFFQEVLGMRIEKTAGAKPMRKVWFEEGIQLNEAEETECAGGLLDHIGIWTEHKTEVLAESKKYGCTPLPNGENWFQTPAGIRIELK